MLRTAFAAFALAAVALSFAGTAYYSGALNSNSPVFRNPGGSSTGVGQYYSVQAFTVGASGAYTLETASPNTGTQFSSNALDTYLLLYANSFNPAAPSGAIAQSDDFSGTFTVLPGPYGNVSATATGEGGTEPGSRIGGVSLTAGTTYYLVNSSYRDTSVPSGGSGSGGPVGAFYTGIGGVGSVNPVPEPATLAALGLGALSLLRRRVRA